MTTSAVCVSRVAPVKQPHQVTTPRSKRSGFTLIELLVVISIISLLIAILLPALASARSRAKQAQCLAQLRQIGIGFTSYAFDNKGWYGKAAYSEPRLFTVDASYWDTYLGNTSKLMTCPDAKAQFIKSTAYAAGHVNTTFVTASYMIIGATGNYPIPTISNYFFGWQGFGWASTKERPAATIPNINYTNGIYDGGTKSLYIAAPSIQPIAADGYDPSGIWGRGTMSFYYNSHPGSTNVAFVDGHAVMRSNAILEQRYRAIWW